MEIILKQNEKQSQTEALVKAQAHLKEMGIEALVKALKEVNKAFDSGEKEVVIKDNTGKILTKIINED